MTWLDALGWAGSALLVYSVMQSRVLRFRLVNLVACLVLVVFNALIAVWPMVGMNVVLAAINLWFIGRLVSQRHDERAFSVIEVAPDDAYLRHVLDVHGADIARFQPDFDPAAEAGRTAYLVLHGDETVGVVLLHRDEAGVARVELDYVTPRFRDFSPGEFVWRRSGLMKAEGFTRVVTPAGMVGAYYDRLGFRREGDRFVLEL
ncbi:MAG TPA: hypothetical protein VFG88_04935 [Nocardioidaceae bacterium]|jgi:hypothetical protein|nr:hypothetical protein [Nocardioidaceae bacterium]